MAGIYCATSTGAQFGPMTLRSSQFSDANQWGSNRSYWSTIQFADVNGDGWLDVCGRSSIGIVCAFNNKVQGNVQFINPVWTTNQYTDAFGWGAEKYYSTIHFADINGDGAADVCGRGSAGFYCGLAPYNQLSQTWAFVGAQSVVAPEFSDQNGWNTEPHYKCLWLIANLDGTAAKPNPAICGRGTDGIYCARSTSTKGSLINPGRISFGPASLYVNGFGDINYWDTSASYYATVQPAHPISTAPGGAPRVEFCGRGDAGILCSN